MAKFISIPEISDFLEHLKFVSTSELFTERMRLMEDLRQQINAAIATHEKHSDIDDAVARARAKLTESEAIRKQADDYAATIKAKADKSYAESLEQAASMIEDLKREAKRHDARAADLERLSVTLDAREKALAQAKAKVEQEAQQVVKQAADAARIKATYEEKLRQIRAVTE